MIEEVARLHHTGIPLEALEFYGLEYRFVAQYLKGALNKNDMFQKLNSAIHQLAKRQETWFRRMERQGVSNPWIDGNQDPAVIHFKTLSKKIRVIFFDMIPSSVKKYLDTRGLCGLWKIAGTQQGGFEGAVVIPSLAETDFLFTTLHALAQNPSELLQRFLIVVVVNHREDAPLSAKMDNHQTLQRLAAKNPSLDNLHLAWVDAASSGLELPKKREEWG